MFNFSVQGRIGSINEHRNNALAISLAAERLAENKDGQYTKTEWVRCVSFDAALNKAMLEALEVGQTVTLEGRIVPKLRDKNAAQSLYDPMLEITRFARGAKPKANGKANAAEPETASSPV
jgi:single-stranded DNA-binding protein